jgi:hypothetical protein
LRERSFMSESQSAFAAFAALGYGSRLIPIIPVDAEISERSSLKKRQMAGDDARGKAPGVRRPDGRWSGFDWRSHQTIESDLQRWAAMGAGVGIKAGELLAVVDADTLNEGLAGAIKKTLEDIAGPCPARVGRYPKVAYVLRTTEPYRYARVEFGRANGHPRERVEILSDGRQFVAAGVHPGTREPYWWPRGAPHYDDLPVVTPQQLDAIMARLREILPEAGPVSREGSGIEVDQATLRGPLEAVCAAVAAIPNTSARFPSRESYLAMGYAIKAALTDQTAAFALFSQWCSGWIGPNGEINEPGIV